MVVLKCLKTLGFGLSCTYLLGQFISSINAAGEHCSLFAFCTSCHCIYNSFTLFFFERKLSFDVEPIRHCILNLVFGIQLALFFLLACLPFRLVLVPHLLHCTTFEGFPTVLRLVSSNHSWPFYSKSLAFRKTLFVPLNIYISFTLFVMNATHFLCSTTIFTGFRCAFEVHFCGHSLHWVSNSTGN